MKCYIQIIELLTLKIYKMGICWQWQSNKMLPKTWLSWCIAWQLWCPKIQILDELLEYYWYSTSTWKFWTDSMTITSFSVLSCSVNMFVYLLTIYRTVRLKWCDWYWITHDYYPIYVSPFLSVVLWQIILVKRVLVLTHHGFGRHWFGLRWVQDFQ